jgi:DNA primase catalytic subunit
VIKLGISDRKFIVDYLGGANGTRRVFIKERSRRVREGCDNGSRGQRQSLEDAAVQC